MKYVITLNFFVLLNPIVWVFSLPTGAPNYDFTCSDMIPLHGHTPLDHATSPFSLSHLTTYTPGRTHTISVLSRDSSRIIRGLFLQARRVGDGIANDSSAIVGTWTISGAQETAGYQVTECSSLGDAVTHQRRNADTNVSFSWYAPEDLTDDVQFLTTVVENATTYWVRLVGPVTTEMDPCAETRCLNNGTCIVNTDSSTVCACARGFVGPYCATEICTSRSCRNGAVCNKMDGVEICTCREGFSGQFCEITITPCTSNPCMSGGTCRVRNEDAFECSCPENRDGSLCETPVCPPDTCKHGATCKVVMDTTGNTEEVYECRCLPGYTGDRCEQETDECQSNPCQNGGRCINEVNRYSCECLEGFDGERCQNYCVGNFTCENFGSCQYNKNSSSLYCICLPGYVGDKCEIEKDFCLENPCPEGSLCIRKLNGFLCKCTRFSDEDCVDTPEPPDVCAPGSHMCPENTCVPLFNSYFCNCAVNHSNTNYCGQVIMSPEIIENYPTDKPPDEGHEAPLWLLAAGMGGVLVIVFVSAVVVTHCSRR